MSHVSKEIIKNLSIDCVIFGFEKSVLEILLIRRAVKPEKGKWALPGGFLKKDELIVNAAKRILRDTTGLNNIYLEEIALFDQIDRYPIRRVFTIGHFALISPENYNLTTGIDTIDVKWFLLNELPELPFNHKRIIDTALEKLRSRIKYKPIGFELLPKKFTLPQLQNLYEVIIDKKLDKRNFRKKILSMGMLRQLEEKDTKSKRRAASLYKFEKETYNRLKKNGFIFEV